MTKNLGIAYVVTQHEKTTGLCTQTTYNHSYYSMYIHYHENCAGLPSIACMELFNFDPKNVVKVYMHKSPIFSHPGSLVVSIVS